jgi:hypothetical protein
MLVYHHALRSQFALGQERRTVDGKVLPRRRGPFVAYLMQYLKLFAMDLEESREVFGLPSPCDVYLK